MQLATLKHAKKRMKLALLKWKLNATLLMNHELQKEYACSLQFYLVGKDRFGDAETLPFKQWQLAKIGTCGDAFFFFPHLLSISPSHFFQKIPLTKTPQDSTDVQESYNTPLEHTPGNPLSQLRKESLYSLLVEVARGVFQFGVLKQPLDRCDFVRSSGGILNLWIGRDVTRLRDHCHTFRIDDDGSFGVAVFRRFLLLRWGWLVGWLVIYIYIYNIFFPTEMEMDVFLFGSLWVFTRHI